MEKEPKPFMKWKVEEEGHEKRMACPWNIISLWLPQFILIVICISSQTVPIHYSVPPSLFPWTWSRGKTAREVLFGQDYSGDSQESPCASEHHPINFWKLKQISLNWTGLPSKDIAVTKSFYVTVFQRDDPGWLSCLSKQTCKQSLCLCLDN